jgi:hypothetical protein
MAESEITPREITLELIFRQGQRILRDLAQIREKQDEIVVRLSRLEREAASLHLDFAGLSMRLDNLDRRVARIERRLELSEEPV